MNRLRMLVCSGALLCALEPLASAQMGAWNSMHDRFLLESPKTEVVINGFNFELRPKVYALYKVDPSFFELLADAAKAYGAFLPPGDKLKRFTIHNPGELGGGSSARFPGAIAMSFEDFTFLKKHPGLRRAHLLQIFLHEFGHKVFHKDQRHELMEKVYGEVMQEARWGRERQNLFFALFTDSRYELISDGCGHPWSNADELFASAFMLTLAHPAQLRNRIASANPSVRKYAEELFEYMQKVTRTLPKPAQFLKKELKTDMPLKRAAFLCSITPPVRYAHPDVATVRLYFHNRGRFPPHRQWSRFL